MTRFDVAVLSFRILALYFLLGTLRGVAQVVGILAGDWPEPVQVLPWSLPISLIAVLGVLLFWMAPVIARGLFKGDQPMSTASRPEIGALALQVCGILLFADCLAQSAGFFDSHASRSVVGQLAAGMLGAVGALMFVSAPLVSRRLFGAPAKPLLTHVQAVTFSVVGIWLLVTSLGSLAESMRERFVQDVWTRGVWGHMATALLGLLLFLGGAGLSAIWHWVQDAGLNTRAQSPR